MTKSSLVVLLRGFYLKTITITQSQLFASLYYGK